MERKIAIVGAGPIGLEAALFAKLSGYQVAVYERGTIAENLRSWGHVRLFSPFGWNASPWGRDALQEAGHTLPHEVELLTGQEFVDRYLLPLSQLPELADCIHTETEVQAIGRRKQLKQDHIGNPARGQSPFQLLIAHPEGEGRVFADSVLDCSGTFPHHNWAGTGGAPCPGERRFLDQTHYQLPDILGADQDRFANRMVLIIGGGYSAATAIVAIGELAKSAPQTKAVWLTRTESEVPIAVIESDALPERKRLTRTANQLALDSEGPIDWRSGSEMVSIIKAEEGRLRITLENDEGTVEKIVADHVLAQVGYRPDRTLYEELQVHECYASQGPMKLAAALLGETSTDCLAQTSPGGDTLKNPEPNFYLLGAKSYGRNSRFLLKIGIEQIREVFSLIAQHQTLPIPD